MPTIYVPCNLGDKIYHIHPVKVAKGQPQVFHVHEAVVAAIHFGRTLYTTNAHSDTYIRLADPRTGYMSARITFEAYATDCFTDYNSAMKEAKHRAESVNGTAY